jgi:F/Y-rich N-terminus/PHD-zinc-finger like domain
MQDGSVNYGGFPQPQQQSAPPQNPVQVQAQQQMQLQIQQQPSPRAAGGAVTPQSPHQLLSPGPHSTMTAPMRSPHMGPQPQPQQQQQMMQGPGMVIQQQSHMGMMPAPSPSAMAQQQHPPNMGMVGPPPSPAPQQQLQGPNMMGPMSNPMMQQQRAMGQQVTPMMQQYPQQPQQQQIQHPGQQAGQQQQMLLLQGTPAPQPSPAGVGPQSMGVNVSVGSAQSPRLLQHSPMMQQQGPPPSPGMMQQPNRPVLQQQQRPMPTPSPMTMTGQMQHSPMPPMTMTPTPSPGQVAVSSAQPHLQQQHSASPMGMAQHSPHTSMMPSPRMGTPLSQHSEDNAASPFSPGPMSSPQPGLGAMRLTSPQAHPPRLPSPQQPAGAVRMIGNPGAPGPNSAGGIRPPVHQQVYGGSVDQVRPGGQVVPGMPVRFVRPTGQVVSVGPEGGNPMMLRQRFPMAAALQQQAAQLQNMQANPNQPNMQMMHPQQQQSGGQPQPMTQQQMQQQQMQMQMQQQMQQTNMAQQQMQQQQMQQQNMAQQQMQQQQMQQPNMAQQQMQQQMQHPNMAQQQLQQPNMPPQQMQQSNMAQQMQQQNMPQQMQQQNMPQQMQQQQMQHHQQIQQQQQFMQQKMQQQNPQQVNFGQQQQQYPPSSQMMQPQQPNPQQQQYGAMQNPMQQQPQQQPNQQQYQYQNHMQMQQQQHQFQQQPQQQQMYAANQQQMMRPSINYSQANPIHRPPSLSGMDSGCLGSPRTPGARPGSVPQSPAAYSHPGTPGGSITSPATVQANLASPAAAAASSTPVQAQPVVPASHPPVPMIPEPMGEAHPEPGNGGGGGGGPAGPIPFIEYDSYGFPKLGLKGGSPLSPVVAVKSESPPVAEETTTTTAPTPVRTETVDTTQEADEQVVSSSQTPEPVVTKLVENSMNNHASSGATAVGSAEEAEKPEVAAVVVVKTEETSIPVVDSSVKVETTSDLPSQNDSVPSSSTPPATIKQEHAESSTPATSAPADENPLMQQQQQQQQQNALLKQLLQGIGAASSSSSSSTPSGTPPATTSNNGGNGNSILSRPTSLMGLLSKPVTSTTSTIGNSINASSTPTRSLLGASSLASQLAQPIAPPPANIPTAQIAQIVSRVPQPTPLVRPSQTIVQTTAITTTGATVSTFTVRPPIAVTAVIAQQTQQSQVNRQPTPPSTAVQQAPQQLPVPVQQPTQFTMQNQPPPQTQPQVQFRPQPQPQPQPQAQAQAPPKAPTPTIKQEIVAEQPTSIKMEVEENDNSMECPPSSEHTTPEPPMRSKDAATLSSEEARKIKRRQYQQKRRQSCAKEGPTAAGAVVGTVTTVAIGPNSSVHPTTPVTPGGSFAAAAVGPAPGGSGVGGQAKKRFRKGSKYEEDYDAYIESTMTQLRALPPLTILEPQLGRNYSVCPAFGSGDLSKLCERKIGRNGDLKGVFGAATLGGVSDYYNTRPFGDGLPVPPLPVPSTQRGFYHQEFAWPRLGPLEDGRSSRCSTPEGRDTCDTPDTVVSSSSPECVLPEPNIRYPGLKYIEESDTEDESSESMESNGAKWSTRCQSPEIPICTPTPIRLVASMGGAALPGNKDGDDLQDKENLGLAREHQALKARFGLSPPVPLKDTANVTVTLTLNAAAAEDVTNVLCRLATLLRVPPPTGFQIIERTTTPPSQRLGLYRFKGKDGKEGAPVDIQSILNGTAKFCRHCDVVILGSNMICKKASLFHNNVNGSGGSSSGLGSPDSSLSSGVEEGYYFCSSSCFIQFAVTNRVGLTPEEKAAAVVDHLSSDPQADGLGKSAPDAHIKSDVNSAAVVAANSILSGATAVANRSLSSGGYPTSLVPGKPVKRPSEDVSFSSLSAAISIVNSTINSSAQASGAPPAKKWKGIKYRKWTSQPQTTPQPWQQLPLKKYKKPTENELTEMLYRSGICIRPTPPTKMPEDKRKCMFCHQFGDGVSDGPARLLNFDVDRWVHLNCALWHEEVFEMVNGALMNVDIALKQSLVQTCLHCQQNGATVKCFKTRCSSVYHLGCAIKEGCVFLKNKTVYCSQHIPKGDKEDQLTTLAVFRRVYINRDENRQVAAVMHHSLDQTFLLRVGTLTFLSVGQLLPHQLAAFHSSNCIYPIGYQIVRFYWSPRVPHKRCRFVCSIEEVEGRPHFQVVVQEPERNLEDLVFKVSICHPLILTLPL